MNNVNYGNLSTEQLEELLEQANQVLKERYNEKQPTDWHNLVAHIQEYLRKHSKILIETNYEVIKIDLDCVFCNHGRNGTIIISEDDD